MSLLIGTATGLLRLGEPEPLFGGTRVNHVARAEDGWWAVDGKARVHNDGAVVATMPEGITPLCIQPTRETIWIGANQARLFGFEDGVVAEDEFFADAPGRDTWYTPWGAPADVRSMTLDADHTLYVNVHVGGVLRYDNTGVIPTLEVGADAHQVAAHPTRQGAVFAATAYGLAQTTNGHDYQTRSSGLHASYCRAVAVSEDMVIVSASTGPSTTRGRLYRTGLWEGDFEPLGSGLPDWFDDNVDSHCVLATDGDLYVGFGDTIWQSDDAGDTWQEIAGQLPRITCLA